MAIEKHDQIINLRRVCDFIKIPKYTSSSPVRSLNNLIHLVVQRKFRLL